MHEFSARVYVLKGVCNVVRKGFPSLSVMPAVAIYH